MPAVFDTVCNAPGPGHVVIVISPLLALINDQVANLREIGADAISLSHVKNYDKKKKIGTPNQQTSSRSIIIHPGAFFNENFQCTGGVVQKANLK